MKNYLSLLVLSFLFINCKNSQENISLFNGKNLEGWYAYNEKLGKQENALNIFKVENQMIRLYGDTSGYLMSDTSFDNFELSLEFRWNTDTSFTRRIDVKNSGVMYLVPLDTTDKLWPKGIQFQVKEGHTGDFILLGETSLKLKGVLIPPGKSVVVERFEEAEKPFGEWNKMVISCKEGHIKQWLNGKLVNEGTEASIEKGRILLQYEGYPIDFKDIQIKKL